jgi:hypothetical protein
MAYIVVVEHDTKGIVLIPTEIMDVQEAIERAKIENPGPGYDWRNATGRICSRRVGRLTAALRRGCYVVSTRVNHVANDDAECAAPVEWLCSRHRGTAHPVSSAQSRFAQT